MDFFKKVLAGSSGVALPTMAVTWEGGSNTLFYVLTTYASSKSLYTEGNYSFTEAAGVHSPDNTGSHNTTAFIEGTMDVDATVNWSVSSEASDVGILWRNEVNMTNLRSGTDSGSFSITAGQKLSFAYGKNASVSSGDDELLVWFS